MNRGGSACRPLEAVAKDHGDGVEGEEDGEEDDDDKKKEGKVKNKEGKKEEKAKEQ